MTTAIGSLLSHVPLPSYPELREATLHAITNRLPFSGRLVSLRLNNFKTGKQPSFLIQSKFGAAQWEVMPQREWRVLKTFRKVQILTVKDIYEKYKSVSEERGLNVGYCCFDDFANAEGPLLASWLARVGSILSDDAITFLVKTHPYKYPQSDSVRQNINLTYIEVMELVTAKLLTVEEARAEDSKAVELTLELQHNCEQVLEEYFKLTSTFNRTPALCPKMDAVLEALDHVCGENPDGKQKTFLRMIENNEATGSTLDTLIKAAAKQLKSVTRQVQELTVGTDGISVSFQ